MIPLDFRNFIKQRKVLLSLIGASAAVLIGLLGVLVWLERPAGATQEDTMASSLPPTSETGNVQTGTQNTGGEQHPTSQETAPSQTTDQSTEPEEAVTVPPAEGNTGQNPGGTGTPPKTDGSVQQDTPTESTDKPDEKTELLTCDRYSLFSGQYVEDGRDELVTNVAAILVTNRSDQFLDLATINFNIDGKEAVFRVSGLPAGRSAWVLEANRMTVTNSSVFTYVDMVTGFRENVISSTDKITITCSGNMLTATNNTNEKLEGVFVYYRVLHTDGNYFGGITYVVDFGTLPPGSSVEKLAGHFSADKARIVRIGWSGQ